MGSRCSPATTLRPLPSGRDGPVFAWDGPVRRIPPQVGPADVRFDGPPGPPRRACGQGPRLARAAATACPWERPRVPARRDLAWPGRRRPRARGNGPRRAGARGLRLAAGRDRWVSADAGAGVTARTDPGWSRVGPRLAAGRNLGRHLPWPRDWASIGPGAGAGRPRQPLRAASPTPSAPSCGVRTCRAVRTPAVGTPQAARLRLPDARVEPRVGQVDQQVHHQEGQRVDHHRPLDHRVVPGEDGLDHQPS